MLQLMERVESLDDHREFQEAANDRPKHQALIRQAGAEANVLLKNNGALLLKADGTIAVIGPNAKTAQTMAAAAPSSIPIIAFPLGRAWQQRWAKTGRATRPAAPITTSNPC
ncbi:MAG: hypothetical protein MO846_00030 [Candidatus Devosia symbiotica]|nr:hypothetical protein [Candidatus Devosia symbiotica]